MYRSYYCFLLILFSCNNSDKKHHQFSDGNKKDTTRYNLSFSPASGSTWYYGTVNNVSMEQEVKGQKVTTSNRAEGGMNYIISRDSGMNYIVKMGYDKFIIYMSAPGYEKQIDISKAGSYINPSDKIFSALNGTIFTAYISPKGIVEKVEGFKELENKMIALSGTPNKQMLETVIKPFVSEKLVKEKVQSNFNIYPGKEIKAGDTWDIAAIMQSDFNFPYTNNFLLEGVEKGVAYISSSAKIMLKNHPFTINGYKVETSITGSIDGEYEIDITTGMILNATIKGKLTGKMEVLGNEVPFTMKIVQSIVGKRK